MKKLLTLLLLLITSLTLAQSITNYTFTASSGTYTPLSGATTATLSSGSNDEGAYNGLPIGFTFVYMGLPYTTVSYSTNGWMTFGQNITAYAFTNNLTSGGTRPIVAPLWDDLDMASGNVQYKTEGTAPNRVFTLQVSNVEWNYLASGGVISFQIKLYENNGAVEFVYNQESVAVNSGSASIGITATATGSGNFLSLDGTGGSPTASSTTETTTLSTKPANGQTYTFTPPAAPADPTNLSFPNIGAYGMTLNWTDNATNETNYLIYRSLDNVNFTLVATLAANSTSYIATGLNPSTTYYWRVFAINEGRLSNALSGSQATNAPSLSGTKTIGASGDYATLTAAIADIQSQGLAGALTLEFLSGYTSGSETFPITFTNLTTTATNTLTVRPQSGVTGISISSSNTTATIRIVNEDYVFIDGRPGGTGTNREITITNTSTGAAVLFIDDASFNTIRYCNVVGSANTSNTSGVIFFSTTANTTGNDNNTIEYCDINALGSAVGIYSAGTTGKENNDNTISNNRIRDFYISSTSTTSTYGIRIHTASTKFTISGNSLYQTAPRAYSTTAVIHYGISLNNTSGNEFTITNNFIGGSDVNCGGSAYTISSGSARFWAMEINVGTTTATSIQGNTIANFNVSSGFTADGSTLFGGMVITAGATNVGTTSGNTIGSTSGTSITVNLTAAATGPIIAGIATTGGTPHNINNNTIAGITVTATSATAYGNLYAISLGSSSAVTTVDGNTIGSSSGSINNNSGSGAVTTQYVTAGIRVTAGSGTTGITINNNTIQYMNMPAGASNTGATLYGLQLTSAGTVYTVTNNTVRNLTTGSARTTGTTSASLIGINHQGTTSPTIIRGNTVHSLSQTAASAAVVVYGILASGTTSGNFELSGNFVHSISLATSSTTAVLEGIYFVSGVYRVFNNMVRLGIDAAGSSVSGNFSISGIRKATTSNQTIVFNSVFIGGSVASGTVNTFGLRRTSVGASDSIYNNIFVNSRSNISGTARHYAISTSSASGLEDYNLFYANGTGGAVGSVDGGTTAQTTLANYQSAFSGRNINSGYGAPNYVDATGDASAVDLHLQSPTAAEGWGSTAFNYISTDFDGGTRSSLTPVDIGADAGNFTFDDIFLPSISYTALSKTGLTSNRTLASVTITDHTGVPTSGSLQPRIWFRRSAPTASSWGSTQGSLQSGSGTNGVWNFTIDYSVLSITPTAGETYQYYVVAQDEATTPNISTNPAGGVHTDVNTQTSPPTTPNSYNIAFSITGSYNVGASETYTSLTGASGFFKFVNDNVVTGNVTVNITSDLTEDGTNGLNQWVEEGGSGFTMLIQSSAATERIISGVVATGMIRLNGADRVTIDGRVSGSGKYLRFRNTNSSNPTITLINDASDNTIRDCYIEGATTSTSNGVVFFSTGATTGNDNNTIRDCIIRDRSDAAGVPANLVYSAGTSTSIANNNNTILNNELFNFTSTAIFITGIGNGNEWNISDNKIYQTATRTTNLKGINVQAGGNHTISNNSIGGSAPDRSGAPLTVTTTTTTPIFEGILFNSTSGLPTTTISNNVISNINITSTSDPNFHGINITGSGNVSITNNTIGGKANAWDTIMTGSDTYVIRQQSTGSVTISSNTIGNIRMTSTSADWLRGISETGSGSINTITGNTIRDLITEASTSTSIWSACAGIVLTSNGAGQVVSQNAVYNLENRSSIASAPVTGIYVEGVSSTPTATEIKRNRIYNLITTGTGTGTSSPQAFGIYVSSGSATYHNNQIHLGSTLTNDTRIRGIQDAGTGTNNYYYNSVLISGTASTGSNKTYSFLRSSSTTVLLRNNLFHNNRTGGDSAHYSIGNINTTPSVGWSSTASNYNLLVAQDVTRIGEWSAGLGRTFAQWKTSSGGDANSYSDIASNISASNLFIDISTGNLNIDSTKVECWRVNGKGILIASIGIDYDGDSRNTSATGLPTDIGADEFNASVPSPAATASGSPAPSTTTTYSVSGNTVTSIAWGPSGTVPTSVDVQYYSGTPAPYSGTKPRINAYWNITQTGGSGFTYDITLTYDEAQLGSINENNLVPAKSDDGGTTWTPYTVEGTGAGQFQRNTAANTITLYGMTSFSYFTLGDEGDPLPVQLSSFTANVNNRDITLNWRTETEVNSAKFELERKYKDNEWTSIAEVKASGNSNSPKEYSYLDKKLNSGVYQYRLKMIDNDGTYLYSDVVEGNVELPKEYGISQNYPNPFNPTTRIDYQLPFDSKVMVELYSITGEKVGELINGINEAGYYNIEVNGSSLRLSSGVYIYRIIATNLTNGQVYMNVKKMMMLK